MPIGERIVAPAVEGRALLQAEDVALHWVCLALDGQQAGWHSRVALLLLQDGATWLAIGSVSTRVGDFHTHTHTAIRCEESKRALNVSTLADAWFASRVAPLCRGCSNHSPRPHSK